LRRVILILLGLVVLAPSMAHASAWYRCAEDGQTRTSCCCPPKASHHKAPASNTSIRSACCCTVTQLKATGSSVRTAPPVALDAAPAVAPVTISFAPAATPIRAVAIERAHAPRGPPEPLFVRHCSLLL